MKLVKLVFSVLIIFALVPLEAFAHTEVYNGTIFLITHVEPGDMPVEGGVSEFNFELGDTQKKFDLSKCICELILTKAGEKVFRIPLKPLSDLDLLHAKQEYVFKEAGIYGVEIAASPKEGSIFKPFSLITSVRVEKSDAVINVLQHNEGSEHDSFHLVQQGILAFSAVSVLGFVLGQKIKERKIKK